MIVWDRVSVGYDGATVLGPLSIEVGDGQWVGLVGPNGAGKTTFLKFALGLVPGEGTVRIGGGLTGRGKDVAWMPQRPSMPEQMGVSDYVMFGRTPHIGYLGSEGNADRNAVDEALRRLDLVELARRPLGTLSGGEAQRAVLARAIAQAAPVLLLDEPTANLDLGHGIEVMEVIDALRRESNLTVVTAIHDLTLAGRFCDRLVLLASGTVVADGTPLQVLTEPVLRPHYGDGIRVIDDPEGPLVVPGRRPM